MAQDHNVNLELIETIDLISEVARRFDHTVFCGIRNFGNGHNEVCRHYEGNHHACMGAAFDLLSMVRDELEHNEELDDE